MSFLTEWITNIIVFILLAVVIDLLLPNSSMQKYAKMVISLLLIIVIINPIFKIFSTDMNDVLAEFNLQAVSEDENGKNLIEFQKKEIQASQRAYILEQMAVQLKNIAEPELKDAFAAEIANIEFVFENNRQASYENLNEIIVTLTEGKKEEGMMKAVEDVEINTDEPLKKLDNDEEIIAYLEKVWELQDKKITIFWEGGTS